MREQYEIRQRKPIATASDEPKPHRGLIDKTKFGWGGRFLFVAGWHI